MSDPLLWEDISFAEPLPPPGVWRPSPPLRFDISAARIDANEKVYYDELRREGAKEEEARAVAGGAAHGLSGVALWPRLILDPKGDIVVESRGPRGEGQKSHWQMKPTLAHTTALTASYTRLFLSPRRLGVPSRGAAGAWRRRRRRS